MSDIQIDKPKQVDPISKVAMEASLNYLKEINLPKLKLAAQQALLGEIRPNMRRIYVGYHKEKNEETIILYFFYDIPPSDEDLDYDVEGTIITEMSVFFTIDVAWDSRSYIVPYPQRIVGPSDLCVYARYEPTPEGEK